METKISLALGLSVSLIALILAGAGVLSVFEGPNEDKNCQAALKLFSDGIADKAAKLSVGLSNSLKEDALNGEDVRLIIMSEGQFDNFIKRLDDIHTLNKLSNVIMLQNGTCPNNWNFVNSIWNSGIILTSVGFAHTAPTTFEGKLFTSFFVLLGVPLFFVTCFVIAQIFAQKIFVQMIKLTPTTQNITITGLAFLVCSLCTLVPAAILTFLENKSFFESWYFACVTIMTVGIGSFKLTGVAKPCWLFWIIIAVILQLLVCILFYLKVTLTEFKKQQILGVEEARLLDQPDGKLLYGGGMAYRATLAPGYLNQFPYLYDQDEYHTLSTLPVKLVDPQTLLAEDDEEPDSRSTSENVKETLKDSDQKS